MANAEAMKAAASRASSAWWMVSSNMNQFVGSGKLLTLLQRLVDQLGDLTREAVWIGRIKDTASIVAGYSATLDSLLSVHEAMGDPGARNARAALDGLIDAANAVMTAADEEATS